MIPWELLESEPTPDGKSVMTLNRRGGDWSIRVAGKELMSSRLHASEDALARLGCEALGGRKEPRVLIGGLGMGFTLAAATAALPPGATIEVAELMAGVIRWNREHLGALAGHPLDDPRVVVVPGDVRGPLEAGRGRYDAILLDVDNGPEGLTQPGNAWLYGDAGLARIRLALVRGGVLGVWSASADERFTKRLARAGFRAQEHRVRARPNGKGARHTVWIAQS